jgi:NADPH:quinone reductase-like Zn-dependent oxidoreductase
MKTVIYEKYGSPDVLQLRDIAHPVPKDNEVLIRVYSTAVNSGDIRLRKADPFAVRFFMGLLRPRKKILGVVFAGIVESIGKEVTKFKEGERVYGSTGMSLGTYSEYITISENGVLVAKPDEMIYKEAAAIPFGATTALHFLRQAKI